MCTHSTAGYYSRILAISDPSRAQLTERRLLATELFKLRLERTQSSVTDVCSVDEGEQILQGDNRDDV